MSKTAKEDSKKKKTNLEKTWQEIGQELRHDPLKLWTYATALRGPDVADEATNAKTLFSCPLRGRCSQAFGVDDFLSLTPDQIESYFTATYERREELQHYLDHITEVWMELYPTLGEMLGHAFGGYIRPKKAARRYVELLTKWLHHTSVVMEEEGDEEEMKDMNNTPTIFGGYDG